MSAWIALPLVIPLLAAALGAVAWRSPGAQRAISIAGSSAHACAALALLHEVAERGILTSRIGGWPAPFGITFVADPLAAIVLAATSIVALAVVVFAIEGVDRGRQAFGFHPIAQVVIAGTTGALLTGDLFDLFVWIEVQLLGSFVLLALGGERAQLEGSLKYVALNLVASSMLLAAIGLLYGLTGALDMAEIAARLRALEPNVTVTAAALLLLVALAIKSAAFPLFFWLPASYHTPPAAVTALLAAMLTKVGVYATIRVTALLFAGRVGVADDVLAWIAAPTMITGVLGAAASHGVRRILSFHIVSQIGYMMMGVAIGGVLGLAGAIFFVVHNVLTKSALLLAAGAIERARGTGDLERLGGLARASPLLAGLFLVPALSLAGIPPLSGFVGKLVLVRAGVESGAWINTVAALVVSLLTLYSMAKIWLGAFWGRAPGGSEPHAPAPLRLPRSMLAAIALLAAPSVLLGVLAQPALALCVDAAHVLLDPAAYVAAVGANAGSPGAEDAGR